MTVVKFLVNQQKLKGFEINGHSSENCDDLLGKTVCAAVSSAAYMAANTVLEVIGQSAEVEISDAKMFFEVEKPNEKTEAVLEGFKLHILQLSEQYSNKIRVTD